MNELRDIYIGDLIELNVDTDLVSEEDIRVAFDRFDMVLVDRKDIGYHVTLMTMTPETYEIELGGQVVVVEVKSTLETIEREDIFEAAVSEVDNNTLWPLWIIFGLSVGLCLFSGLWLLVKKLKKTKEVILTPYELFEKALFEADVNQATYLGEITNVFKTYLSTYLNQPLEGLTSEELILEMTMNEALYPMSEEIKEWLIECDMLKYSRPQEGENRSIMTSMKERLASIVSTIESHLNEKDVA